MPEVQIMTAYIVEGDEVLATVERVKIGGGTQTVTVDGVPEERVHPTFYRHHARLLSPDRMIADQLVETEGFEAAVEIAMKYAAKRIEHAAQVADLAEALKV